MAPSHSRQLLVWTLPTIAVLLSYLWYKKRRIGARSDPGDTTIQRKVQVSCKPLDEELFEKKKDTATVTSSPQATPTRNFSRSLSGVESTPIDIIIPPELRASKSAPLVISDEDLDFEIEKIKSMKNGNLFGSRKESSPKALETSPKSLAPPKSQTPSPVKQTPVKITTKSKKNRKEKDTIKMVQKDLTVVEEKLTSLKIDEKQKIEHKSVSNGTTKQEIDLQRQSSERDSANHSPSDVMMASPSLSSISDNHSEVSIDLFLNISITVDGARNI